MIRFYTASNRFDAYLLADRLKQAGIRAHVFNEHVSSIVGEVSAGGRRSRRCGSSVSRIASGPRCCWRGSRPTPARQRSTAPHAARRIAGDVRFVLELRLGAVELRRRSTAPQPRKRVAASATPCADLDAIADRHAAAVVGAERRVPGSARSASSSGRSLSAMAEVVLRNRAWPARDRLPRSAGSLRRPVRSALHVPASRARPSGFAGKSGLRMPPTNVVSRTVPSGARPGNMLLEKSEPRMRR